MELSQEEIAEFSQTIKSTDEGARSKQVRPYDFIHPDKLSGMHLRALQSLMSSLERTWPETLLAMLRSEATVALASLEQASFASHAAASADRCMVVGMTLGKLPGMSFLNIPTELALSAVDRLAGGAGKLHGELRDLTQIESKIIKKLISRLSIDLCAAWQPITAMDIDINEFYPSFDDIELDREEMYLVTSFVWGIEPKEYKIALAIPVNAFDSVRDRLTPEQLMQSGQKGNKNASVCAAELLGTVQVDADVELGRARVSVQDIIGVGIGDVIKLGRAADDLLDIRIHGQVKFYGRPGLIGNRLAVQITEQAQDTERTTKAEEEMSNEQ